MPQIGIAGNCQNVYGSQVWANWFALGPTARNLKTWWNYEDWIGGYTGTGAEGVWIKANSGAGAGITDIAGTSLRPGLIQGTTGTTAAGYAGIYTGHALFSTFILGGGVYTFETEIYIPDLSAVAEEYIFRCGFGDSILGDATDGVYFEYNRLTSVNWYRCTANNAARTKTSAGVAVAEDTWTRLKIIINAAGTSAEFFIADTSVGSNIANLPGAGRAFGAYFQIIKSAGLTPRTFQCDWVWLHFDLTTGR